MTKQHFLRAAEIVRSILDGHWTNDAPSWASKDEYLACAVAITSYGRAVQTAEAFINLFSDANPRFDRARFLVACGLAGAPAKVKKGKRA